MGGASRSLTFLWPGKTGRALTRKRTEWRIKPRACPSLEVLEKESELEGDFALARRSCSVEFKGEGGGARCLKKEADVAGKGSW